jgi:hypothetical protein
MTTKEILITITIVVICSLVLTQQTNKPNLKNFAKEKHVCFFATASVTNKKGMATLSRVVTLVKLSLCHRCKVRFIGLAPGFFQQSLG